MMINAAEKLLQQSNIEDRLSDGELSSGLNLVFKTAHLFIDIHHPRICAHTDHEFGSGTNWVSTQIQAKVQVAHEVHQADCIHVKDRRGVGIIAQLGRIAGDADQVANADSGGA